LLTLVIVRVSSMKRPTVAWPTRPGKVGTLAASGQAYPFVLSLLAREDVGAMHNWWVTDVSSRRMTPGLPSIWLANPLRWCEHNPESQVCDIMKWRKALIGPDGERRRPPKVRPNHKMVGSARTLPCTLYVRSKGRGATREASRGRTPQNACGVLRGQQ